MARRTFGLSLGGTPTPLLLGDGVVGGPAYSFATDPDIGLYRIGADILGLATGGTERVRISSSGIKLGTTYTLPLVDGSADQVLRSNGSGTVSWVTVSGVAATNKIVDTDADTWVHTESIADEDIIRFKTATVERMQIGATGIIVINDTGADADLRIEGDTDANLFFLDASADKIGIGTASPTNQLHLYKDSASVSAIAMVEQANSATYSALGLKWLTKSFLWNMGSNDLTLSQSLGGANLLRVNDASGASLDAVLTMEQVDSSYYSAIGLRWLTTRWYWQMGSGDLLLAQSVGGAELLRIKDATGNVGIGIAPTAKLHLKAGTTAAATAPLKFAAGTNMTTPEAGAMEFDGTNLFITQGDGTRKTLAFV